MTIRQLNTNAKILLASMAVCFAVTRPAFSQETFKCGPYDLSPVMNYYVIVEKVPCKVTITVNIKDQNKGERLLMRVYDPDEKQISWIYKDNDDFNVPSSPFARFFNRIMGRKSLISGSNITEEITLKGKVGIYEFRFYGGLFNSTATLESDQKLEYGISWQNGALVPSAETPKTMYIYIPKGLDFLKLSPGGNGIVTIDRGKGVESVSATNTEIVITGHDAVWKADFSKAIRVALDMPMVFCTSEAAARKIKNSVEVSDDGSWVCFIPQEKIPAIIKRLWDKKYIGEPESVIVPLASIKDKLLSNPVKYGDTVGSYGLFPIVPALLREQDKLNGKLPILHMEYLSIAAGIGPEINPYYHKKEIVYRTAVALLYCLYNRLAEDELISSKPGTDTNLSAVSFGAYKRSTHADCWQAVVCYDTAVVADSFGNIGRELEKLDPEAYGVIRALMGRMIDRALPTATHITASKEMNYPIAVWQFYEGTGEERYKEAALRYEYYLIKNSSTAGYSIMYGGPDAIYQGQILGQLAPLYCWTKDEKILDHIKTIYTLFNHTVSPEPNNKIIGASSFCHGTIGGFEQNITPSNWQLADRLPEAAIWMANYYDNNKTYFDEVKSGIIQAITNPPPGDKLLLRHVDLNPAVVFRPDPVKVHEFLEKSGYTWPALEKDDFIRNFGNEFIAVKRKGYYLCVYVGRTLPNGEGSPKKLRKIGDSAKSDGALGWVKRDKSKLSAEQPVEGNQNADYKEFRRLRLIGNIIGYSGGNIVLLWSKDYGASVFGYNVAPTTRHGLIFTDPSGDRWWDDYLKTEFTLDEQFGILHVKGRIENQPVRYERIYDFKDDHLEYTLKLTAESAVSAVALVENFPVAMKYKAMKGREKEESVDIVKADYNGQSAVRMTSKLTGKSVFIANNKNLEVEILPDYVGGQGSVQFKLPASLEAGKEWSVVFSVVPEGLETVKNQ